MNCNENGKLCKCGHPESAHELNHASRRGPCEASAAANSYSLCRCLRFAERATRVAEAAEPAVPVAGEAGWHEPDCVDHGNCHCEAERPLKKALASASNLRQLYRDTLDSRTRLAGRLATVEWQRDAAVKARNEAEDRAEMDQRGFAACSAELESVREALTAEKERAERLESRVKELRVYAFTFRKSKRDERICCNCEEPRHGHYSGPGAEPGIVYCSKYDVPQAPPSVATGERAIVAGSTWQRMGEGSVCVSDVNRRHVNYEWDSGIVGIKTHEEFRGIFAWLSDPPAAPEPGSQGSNESTEKIWQVLSRDADSDDEWEVNDPGPYTRADADRRVEMWSISSSIYRFKTARIPTPTPLTESGNEMLGGGNAGDEGKP